MSLENLRQVARTVATLCLVFVTPAMGVPPVELKEVTHEYDPSLPHFDKALQVALIDSGWLPLTVTEGEVTAQTTVRKQHYAKVRVRFAGGKATFTLLESKDLDQIECVFRRGGKRFLGPCIHPAYYEWLARLMAVVPIAHARIEFVKSLASP